MPEGVQRNTGSNGEGEQKHSEMKESTTSYQGYQISYTPSHSGTVVAQMAAPAPRAQAMAPQTTSGSSAGAVAPNLYQASGPQTQSHSGAVVAQMACATSACQITVEDLRVIYG